MGNHGFGKVLISGLVLGSVKVFAVAWIVFAGYGTFGALVAYVIGSLAGLVLLVMYLPIRLNRPDRDIAQAILAIALPFTISNLGLSIIHSLDLWILKALAVPDMDRDIGVYAATRVLARTPEVVLLPIATVLFPMISKSLVRNEMREAVDHIKGAMRALWLILLPTAAFAAVDAESILRLFFPESYYGGGAFLSLQIAAFCMLTALGTLLVVLRARGDFYSIVFSGAGIARALVHFDVRLGSAVRNAGCSVFIRRDQRDRPHRFGGARVPPVRSADVEVGAHQRSDRADGCSATGGLIGLRCRHLADRQVRGDCGRLRRVVVGDEGTAQRRLEADSFVALSRSAQRGVRPPAARSCRLSPG